MSLLTYLSAYQGTLNDKTMSWLKSWSPWMPNGTMEDLWMAFLQGYQGSLNDRMLAWARATSGLSGSSLNDALLGLPDGGAQYGGASLGLYFDEDKYESGAVGAQPTSKPFSNIITFTRASGGGRFNASGVYEWLGNDVPRLDYDPVTLQPRGILIEEQRTNLLTYSEQFDNAIWQKFAATVTTNAAASPDGASTTDKLIADATNASHYIREVFSFTAGVSYTLTVFAKAAERSMVGLTLPASAFGGIDQLVAFDLVAKTASLKSGAAAFSIADIGSGWVRCSITATASATVSNAAYIFLLTAAGTTTFLGDGTSGIYIWGAQLEAGAFPTSYIPTPATFTSRASTATYFNSSGVLTTAAVNEARYDHRFIGGQWVPTGLLLEAAATNLLTYSEQINSTTYDTVDFPVTLTANAATSPSGLVNASLLSPKTSSTAHAVYRVNGNWPDYTSGTSYTNSVFAKDSGGRFLQLTFGAASFGTSQYANFDLQTGTIGAAVGGTASIIPAGNGWYRCSFTATATSSASAPSLFTLIPSAISGRLPAFVGTPANGIYIWGAQIEAGAFPTSYIPTVASQVTRDADVSSSAQATRSADVASVNTLSPWYNASEGTLYFEGSSFGLGTGSASYAAALTDNSVNEVITIRRNATGFGGAVIDNGAAQAAFAPTYSNGAITKIALAFKANDFALSKDGAAALTDTSCSIPTVDRLNIGATAILSAHLNGHIRNISYYPRRLTDAQLQSLTTP